MLAVLTTAILFIAVVLTVVHWQTVREILLWTAAFLNVMSMLFGLLALLGAAIVFIWAAIAQDATLVPLGVTLALVVVGLGIVCFVMNVFEERDRDKQWARFHAYLKNNKEQAESSETNS